MSLEPIEIVDEDSAKLRINQWIRQKNISIQVELAAKAYKFYHRMVLVEIYKELHNLAVEKYPGKEKKQRAFEKNIMCAHNDIKPRTERRQKKSAFRIKLLINAGISFDLLAKVLNVSDFEVSDVYYDKFLENLKLDEINSNLPNSPSGNVSSSSDDDGGMIGEF